MKKLLTLVLLMGALLSCDTPHQKPDASPDLPAKSLLAAVAPTDTSEQLMNEDRFWAIIDRSRKASGHNYQDQIPALQQILTGLDAGEIAAFDNTFTALLAVSYDYKLWGAGFVINGGCSDDCFDYFREYLIAHGKDMFYATLRDPESCVGWIKPEEDDNWEGIRHAVAGAYKLKTGNDLPATYHPRAELKGQPFDEATVDKQYPKLARKFSAGRGDEE